MLAVHDKLGFRAVATEIVEMAQLLLVCLRQELVSLFQVRDGARLVVHDSLHLAAVREE